jgi:hypothetical protein
MTAARVGWCAALLLAGATAGGVSAQELARRVADLEEGTARVAFPARPEVEICDQGVRWGDRRMWWHSRHGEEEATGCRNGPVEVELHLRDGRVRDVELIRDLDEATPGAVDLGTVPAESAVAYLLDVARDGAVGDRADVLFPTVLADVADVWVDLLAMAREPAVARRVRKSALFWVGQEAARAVTGGLAEVARDEDEEQDIREAAVFALSQRPPDEGIPILMELARTAEDAGTRRSALFWLAQSDDERVPAFFEEILLGRAGG